MVPNDPADTNMTLASGDLALSAGGVTEAAENDSLSPLPAFLGVSTDRQKRTCFARGTARKLSMFESALPPAKDCSANANGV
jgi:hypothetical protein